MLGIDTNVLIRFLTVDDAVQSPQAQALLTRVENQPIYISMLVLAEAFNVLTKVKKQPASAVLEAYALLLRSPALTIERPELVQMAIDEASRTHAGFPDAMIGLQNAEASCVTTATFDIRATRLASMRPVKDFL